MGWKIYFFILTGLLLVLYAITFSGPLEGVLHYLDVPISMVALLGIYGYAFKRPIGHYNLWKIWFFVIVLWDGFYNLIPFKAAVFQPSDLVAILIGYGIIIPGYVALYLYGFRSQSLWERKTQQPTTH